MLLCHSTVYNTQDYTKQRTDLVCFMANDTFEFVLINTYEVSILNKEDISQFRKDFLNGLGSALVTLHSCTDTTPLYPAILYGCLHNTTYDAQCEGDRGWYLHQGAKLSENPVAIEDAVRDKFLIISMIFGCSSSLHLSFFILQLMVAKLPKTHYGNDTIPCLVNFHE